MLDRLLDEFLMESYQNYSDYQNSYNGYFDTLFRANAAIQESVNEVDIIHEKFCVQEATGDLINKIKEFFKNLIEKIKQFIKDIKTAVKNKFQQIQLQRKLTEIKKLLIENRNDREVSTKKVEIFDALKYNAMYNKYIAMIQKEIQALSTTKFKDVEDLNKQINEVSSHITSYAEKLGLTSYEKYKIQVGIMEAMKVAEQSITIYDKQYTVSGDNWVSCITNAEKVCTKDNNILVSDHIATLTQKFSNKCSELFNIMAKHPVKSVAIILGAVTSIYVIRYNFTKNKTYRKKINEKMSEINTHNQNADNIITKAKEEMSDMGEYFDTLAHSRKELTKQEAKYAVLTDALDSAIRKQAHINASKNPNYKDLSSDSVFDTELKERDKIWDSLINLVKED